MSKQSSSDPLPYVQVDRAITPAVAHLASHMKVTNQHALGSLVGFWNLCGDPRELEAIVSATPAGEEPEVVLTADEIALRFQLVSDVKVEPVVLARLHILEERPEGTFRVRGMSRFFDPITRRLSARAAASKAGKASAEARKASTGSSQPVRQTFDGRSTDVEQPFDERRTSVERPLNDRSTPVERPPKTAVSGQRSSSKSTARDSDRLLADFLEVIGSPYAFGGAKDGASLAYLLTVADMEEISRRWRLGLKASTEDWASCRTIAQLRHKWNDLATAKAAAVSIEHQPSRMF